MLIDMHMHEMRYSKDSFLMLEQMVELAKRRGLDGICITDHDSMGLKEFAQRYSLQTGFPIFVGIEYLSLQGDIITFGIEDYPKERIPAQEYISYVQSQGGMCISAHPFRNNNRGLEDNLGWIQGLDGVEVLNGSTPYEPNMRAVEYARARQFATIGASDCHVPEKLGLYATYFQKEIRSVEELIQAVKKRECLPAYYAGGNYYLWDMEHPIDAPFTIQDEERKLCVG